MARVINWFPNMKNVHSSEIGTAGREGRREGGNGFEQDSTFTALTILGAVILPFF